MKAVGAHGSVETAGSPYRLPPESIVALLDAPPAPVPSVDPTSTWLLLLHSRAMKTIRELSRPELRLAGLRIDPATRSPSRAGTYSGLALKELATGRERDVSGLPEDARIGRPRWSPDGTRLAFTITAADGVRLWLLEPETGAARQLLDLPLNAVYADPFDWMPDSARLVVCVVPPDQGEAPPAPEAPSGPVIQESQGSTAPARTYQDLLKGPHDEALFAHLARSRVGLVRTDGAFTFLSEPDLVCAAGPSPDGRYLLVETLHPPFSYLVPADRFPRRVEIWDEAGRLVRAVADLPLAEEVPLSFDAVPDRPRGFGWRADAPATLVWTEPRDGGDPKRDAEVRDAVLSLAAPFRDAPAQLFAFGLRHSGILWGDGGLALGVERWWQSRTVRVWFLQPDRPEAAKRLWVARSWEDRYQDPGAPVLRPTPQGTAVLLTSEDGRALFLAGEGASPEGDRPFLDRLDIASLQTERLWRSQPPLFERTLKVVQTNGPDILLSRESRDAPTNYHWRNLATGEERVLTDFPHPYPQLATVYKELITYKREDGVQLTATLYLPPGRKPGDGPLPTLIWAYPREFKSKDAAGQVKDSPHRFVRIVPGRPHVLLTQGYALLDGPDMPIVGEGDAEPNDRYIEQLVASAKAAVDELVRRGVAERDRLAVAGHSYGAFMTVNLLAHSDLFRAGIAASGAYNRTLTPFGFQAEQRTLWEAPAVYSAMSPYMHADKINAPLLLIHGDADNNAGTFPMQSERLFNALKGHGRTVRLVLLPNESHGYEARESVLHAAWETLAWLDRHLKG